MKRKLFLNLPVILMLVYSLLHAQEKATLSLSANQTAKLGIKVNGQDTGLDEYSLNDLFAGAFSDMLANSNSGINESEREDFFNTYQQFLKQAKEGTYNINSGGGKYLNSTYTGPAGANLGVNPNGTDAIKTLAGRIFSNHHKNDRQRMALLNTYLGDRIIEAYNRHH